MKRVFFISTFCCVVLILARGENVKKPAFRVLGLRIEEIGDVAKLRFATFMLEEPEASNARGLVDRRWVKYSTPVDGEPHRIGWEGKKDLPLIYTAVVLEAKKYVYERPRDIYTDRTASGAISISKEEEKTGADRYGVRGVYWWSGCLFVIDAVLAQGQELVLREPAPADFAFERSE